MKLAFVLSVFALAAAANAFVLECPEENSTDFDGTLTEGQWTLRDHSNGAGVSLFNAFAAGYPNYSFNLGADTDVMIELSEDGGDWTLTISGVSYGGDGGDHKLAIEYTCTNVVENPAGPGLDATGCSGELRQYPDGANTILPVMGKAIGDGSGIELTLYSKDALRFELFAWIKYSPLFDLSATVSGDINGVLECRVTCIPACDLNDPEFNCMDDGCGGVCMCPEGTFCDGNTCAMNPTECLEEGMNWSYDTCGTYGLGELSMSNAIILPNSYAAGPVLINWAEGSGDEGVFDGAYFDYCPPEPFTGAALGDAGGNFAIGGSVIHDGEECTIAYSCNLVAYDAADPEFVRANECSGLIDCPVAGTINLDGKSNSVSEFEIHTKWGVTKGSGWVEYSAWTEEGGIESGGLAHGDINFTFVCQWGGLSEGDI